MPDEPFKVSGFDDSTPASLSKRLREGLPHIETRGEFDTRSQNEIAEARERAAIDLRVDNRLFALKGHVETLHAQIKTVNDRTVALETSMSRNNEMTEKILAAVSGGKFLVGLIKFAGALAVPIAAIWGLIYTLTHGGPPPGHP